MPDVYKSVIIHWNTLFSILGKASMGRDLQSKLSVYQAGAGVKSSKKSSPKGIKSETLR